MMKSYKKYTEYKDSGVDWLGEIPNHWNSIRANYVFDTINERSIYGKEELLSVSEYHGVRPRSISNVTMFMAESYIGYKLCEVDDLVINSLWAWSKGLGISKYDGIVSTAYSVYRPRQDKYSPSFLNYLLRTKMYVDQYSIYSKGIWISRLQLSDWSFLRIPILSPPLSEQQKIADFLDKKTSDIDKAITQKEQLIDLLKERKQILINNAVTCGLNSDAKFKDSGIDWIGEIPEHWEVKKIRHIGQTQNGISKSGEFFGHGDPFVSYGNVYNNEIIPECISGLVHSSIDEQKTFSVKKGDVFFTRTSEVVEEVGLSSVCYNDINKGTFAGFLIRFRPKQKILDPSFSRFYFRSQIHRYFFVAEMNIVTRASLSQDLLKKLPVLIPPLSEQINIAAYLEEHTSKIDMAITQKQQEIEALKEYKATLIDSAVRGRIRIN